LIGSAVGAIGTAASISICWRQFRGASSVEQMSSQAEGLQQTMGLFTVAGGPGKAPRRETGKLPQPRAAVLRTLMGMMSANCTQPISCVTSRCVGAASGALFTGRNGWLRLDFHLAVGPDAPDAAPGQQHHCDGSGNVKGNDGVSE